MYLVALIVLGVVGLALMWQLHERMERQRVTKAEVGVQVRADDSRDEPKPQVDLKSQWVRAREEAERYRREEPQPDFRRHQHLMIVCNERIFADALVKTLREHGHAAIAARTGADAIEMARAIRPWMSVIDAAIWDLNAAEIAIRLTTEDPECRAVIMSDRPGARDMIEMAKECGHEFELWPMSVDPKLLLGRVEAIRPTI